MTSATEIITGRVRDRVTREGVDLAGSLGLAEDYAREEVRRYSERALGSTLPLLTDERATEREVVASLTGFGPIQPYLDDPGIEEIWINAPTRVFVARNGIPELTNTVLTESGVRDLVERMLQSTGRRVDLSSPFVDASLPDGSRLHVVIPDVTRRHMAVNIRKFSRQVRDLTSLVSNGSLSVQAAEYLRCCVLAGQNILISGATQAGKTTLLGALLSSVRSNERIVTVEETFELDLAAGDVVAMQCRQPSLEGTGEITLRRLIKEALRMRPDRLIVGEVREAESLDLLIALNSGVPGMCSIHANSARDALVKLSTLPLLAGRNIDSSFVQPTVAGCIDVVVHCEMDRGGFRRVTQIVAPSGALNGPVIEASVLFALRDGLLEPTGSHPTRVVKFENAGINPAAILRRGA
ncbi:pilus assembly protein CpaF [Mycetocola sp. CAN_C7]|uniref:CpaF family protein n=1 Tax=Mycetocola sp. CAN_C7 TaxID=2787724 RepID=UPI0018C99724